MRDITEGIDPDGTVNDCVVETHWLPIESVSVAEGEGGYVRLRADGGSIDYEMRVLLSDIKKWADRYGAT